MRGMGEVKEKPNEARGQRHKGQSEKQTLAKSK